VTRLLTSAAVRRAVVLLVMGMVAMGFVPSASAVKPPPSSKLRLSPAGHGYGNVPIGDKTAPFTFTVTNKGTSPTGPVSFSVTGPNAGEFSAASGASNGCVSGTTTLGAGESCTIDVKFGPIPPAGKKSATLNVSDGPDAGAPTASLAGNGVAPTSGCTVGTNNGCISLTNAVESQLLSTSPPLYGTTQYTLSGSIQFSPTCAYGSTGCVYSDFNNWFTGSGTFSLDNGTANLDSGTWTADYYDSGFAPSYTNGSGASTCHDATLRTFYARLFFTGTSTTWQTNYIEIRWEPTNTGTFANIVDLNFASAPTPGDYVNNDLSGVTIDC